jgi:tetratricopeptide (TPR) repeat protein
MPEAPEPIAEVGIDPRIAELARVDPPPFIQLTMRSGDEWRPRFEAAMDQYAAGRYGEAAAALESVASEAPAASTQFFLGICYLMLDRTEQAIAALQRAVDTGSVAFAEEARFFLAKALLRKGDRAGASRALDDVVRRDGPRAAEARDLQAKLAALGPS